MRTDIWPEGVIARAIEKTDAEAWAELVAAKAKVDQDGANDDADDLRARLDDPHLDAGRDTIALWIGRQMVAFGLVRAPDQVVDVHPYDVELRLAHNEIFRDHWGSSPLDAETWRTWFTGARAFRGGLSFLVLAGDQIVAYVLGYEHVADSESTGVREVYVGQVGTRREYRGRGLARVALARVMAEAARSGFERASLGVDAGNPTGALRLYEKLGFRTVMENVAIG